MFLQPTLWFLCRPQEIALGLHYESGEMKGEAVWGIDVSAALAYSGQSCCSSCCHLAALCLSLSMMALIELQKGEAEAQIVILDMAMGFEV